MIIKILNKSQRHHLKWVCKIIVDSFSESNCLGYSANKLLGDILEIGIEISTIIIFNRDDEIFEVMVKE